MILATGRAKVVHVFQEPFGIFGDAVLECRGAPCAVNGAFGRCTVITGDVDDEGILVNAECFHLVEDAAQLGVGVRQETGEHFHESTGHRLVAVGILGPRGHLFGTGR